MREVMDRVLQEMGDRFARDVLKAGGGYNLDSPSLFLNGGCLGDLLRQPLQLEPVEVSIPLPPPPSGDVRVYTRAEYYLVCPQFLPIPGLSC